MQDQAVDLGQAAAVLGRHEPGLRDVRRGGASGRADGQREGARREAGAGRRELARVAAARALAQLLAELAHDLGVELAAEGALRLQLAAAVEDERRAADQRGERARRSTSSPRSLRTIRCRRSWAAIERCSSAYCSLTSRVKACSVTAMNGSS